MNKELCKYYRSWVGTSKGEINCACVDYERKIITKCDFIQNKGCWKTQRKELDNDKTTQSTTMRFLNGRKTWQGGATKKQYSQELNLKITNREKNREYD